MVLLNWFMPSFEVWSRPVFSDWMSASIRDSEASSDVGGLALATSVPPCMKFAVANAPPSAPATAASATTAAIAAIRRLPNTLPCAAASSAPTWMSWSAQACSPRDITMTLPGAAEAFSGAACGSDAGALVSAFAGSTFVTSDNAGSDIEGSSATGSDTTASDAAASLAGPASAAEAAIWSFGASAEWEIPALTEPVSALFGLGSWSLTAILH